MRIRRKRELCRQLPFPRHDAPVVSEKEEGSPADSSDVKENVPEKEEVSKEKETEPREKEEHGEVKETGEAAGTEKEKRRRR